MSESLVTAIYSWLTPTVLFIFLNLIIGTIAITSSLSSKSNDNQNQNQSQIQRSPSVIHRLKSINFSSFTSPPDKTHLQFTPPDNNNNEPASIEQNQPFLSRSPSVLHRIKSFNLYNYISQEPTTVTESPPPQPPPPQPSSVPAVEEDTSPSLEEVYSKLNLNHVVSRTKSDTEPASGVNPPKLPKKMKKSASVKSPFSHFEEDDVVEARRPETVRATRVTPIEEGADEQVDAKADDFINRFKQQLKLQRIDSIAKYKEMVKKGNDK